MAGHAGPAQLCGLPEDCGPASQLCCQRGECIRPAALTALRVELDGHSEAVGLPLMVSTKGSLGIPQKLLFMQCLTV